MPGYPFNPFECNPELPLGATAGDADLAVELAGTAMGSFRFPIGRPLDRKSTRLNSSHSQISYAVFCLKKKKKQRVSPRYFRSAYIETKSMQRLIALNMPLSWCHALRWYSGSSQYTPPCARTWARLPQ